MVSEEHNQENSNAFRLLAALTNAQTDALGQYDPKKIFDTMLDEVLDITDSAFGFMGEVLSSPEGTPYLKSHALTNIAWNTETQAFYEKHQAQGLEFHNLNTLFGAALTTGQPVIANDPELDPRRGGLPKGHPPIKAFLGLPVYLDKKMIGLIGLANRPGGYDEGIITFLEPLLTTYATLIAFIHSEESRDRTEFDLRKSRREWEEIFRAIGDYVLILNPNHEIIEANRTVVEKTGLTIEQLRGRKCHEFFHGTDQPPIGCPLTQMLDSRAPVVAPVEVQTLNGSFLVSCTPLYDEDGNIDRIIHIATDITPAQKAAKELVESEQRFRTYFDQAPIGMAIVGLDEHLLQVNDVLCRMLGYSREILLTKTVPEITHPDDRDQEVSHKRQAQHDSSGNFQMEKRYLHQDGHSVWGHLSVSLMKDGAGNPLYYLGQIQDITTRYENEQALRQALEVSQKERARADAILAAIGEPLTIQGTNFRVIYQNEANKRALGDHLGEYCYTAYEQKSEVCEGCALAKAFADGKIHKAERSVSVGNETRHYEITASPILDADGRPTAGIELARDITGRIQKETLLAEQVRLLSLSSEVGAMLTQAGTVEEILTRCCELMVHHLEAAFARIWTADDQGEFLLLQASAGMYTHLDGPHGRIPINTQTKIGTIASTKQPHTTNTVIGDPQVTNQEWAKKEGMVAFAGHPLLIEDRLVGVLGMFFRQPLAISTSRAIASIADEMALGISRVQTETRLHRSNRALRILSRCNEALIKASSESQLLDEICEMTVEPEGYLMAWVGFAEADAQKTICPVAQAGFVESYLDSMTLSWGEGENGKGPAGTAIRTGRVTMIKDLESDPNFSQWRQEATKRGYTSILCLPLTDLDAKPYGALCIYSGDPNAFDEDEVKLLRELAGDLSFGINTLRLREAQLQEQRERQKLQERLRQAQKIEAIGTLAGGIAHDFNNLLSVILGYTELARGEVGPQSKIGTDLQEVITAAKRASDLVRQILTISRMTEHQRQPIKIQYIIKEALKLLRPSISTSIQINSFIKNDYPEILADPTEIHQVIMNLCTNAYYAMRQVQRENHVLEIRLESVELERKMAIQLGLHLTPGRYVKLTVADTGSGMDPQTMSRIFDPYFTTKKKGEGTGLGLATVHSIVIGSGGDVVVESSLGNGTTFRVYLPVHEGAPGPEPRENRKSADPGGSERILVVDDEGPIARLLQRTLKKSGYQVVAATSSQEANRLFNEDPTAFDLLITDMNMPKMMGTDLARTFLEIRPDLPVILCTGFSEKMDQEQARKMGIKELLFKPVDEEVLARTVRRILDENQVKKDQ
ncbi:MAG: GAF domain-containing protein [Proteobacteria bacterium]|nr:GAF domain-containing protein [Pseudomonadota bacterium]MBU1687850.1 GAF domain-containing protein [Pseudomonadota bacterium]